MADNMLSTVAGGTLERSRGKRECESRKGVNSVKKEEARSSKREEHCERWVCRIRSAEVEESERAPASWRPGKRPLLEANLEEGAHVLDDRHREEEVS